MRLKFAILLLLAGITILPAYAQEAVPSAAIPHSITFDGFSFSYDETLATNLNVLHYPGDPVEGAGAGFSDAANTIFNLYNTWPAPESPLDAQVGIRVYAVRDLAQYDFMQAVVDQLQGLIAERPDLSVYETNTSADASALPYLPIPMHGQMLRTRAQYIETEQVRGISYLVTSPTLAAIEPLTSTSFRYVFQGISTDGQYYVSLIAQIATPLFPAENTSAELEDLSQNWEAVLQESAVTLDEAQPANFAPSLDTFDQLIASFAFAARE
jgi:hypothetical protein